MVERVSDEHLRIALFDAMRGVRLPTLKRTLSDDERRLLASALFEMFQTCRWDVMCHIDYRSAHSSFAKRTE